MKDKSDNEVIAEFDDNVSSSCNTWFHKTKNFHFEIKDAEYDTSWDWFFPAWLKFRDYALGHRDIISEDWLMLLEEDTLSGNIKRASKLLAQGIRTYNQEL